MPGPVLLTSARSFPHVVCRGAFCPVFCVKLQPPLCKMTVCAIEGRAQPEPVSCLLAGLVLTLFITAFLRPGLTTKHWLTPSATRAVRGHLDTDRVCVSKDFSKKATIKDYPLNAMPGLS